MTIDQSIGSLLLREAVFRICDESIPRLIRCVLRLNEQQIWQPPDAVSASIGHLILHLNGNCRQWLLKTLCGKPYDRNRDWEFASMDHLSRSELQLMLLQLDTDIRRSLMHVDTASLLDTFEVQVFRTTGVGIIVHVVEHFSYHTGQVARDTKRLTGYDLGFYEDLDL